MQYLLDTCAVLWLAVDGGPLGDAILADLESPNNEVFVSAITAAELACLVRKNRIELPTHWRRWYRHAIEINGWNVLPVDLEIIEEAYSLPGDFHPDPADRILVASARLHQFTLITGDQKILDYPHVKVAC